MKHIYTPIISLPAQLATISLRQPPSAVLFANDTACWIRLFLILHLSLWLPLGKGIAQDGARVPYPVPLASSPSQDMNYVLTRTAQEGGLTEPAHLAGGTVRQVQESVTYFDGLGRELQTVLIKASPNYLDLVTSVSYDAFGRVAKTYLPYAATGTAGSYRANALTAQPGFYDPGSTAFPDVAKSSHPWAVPVYEPSPLNRVLEQGAPGDAWQPLASGATDAGHTVKSSFRTNAPGEVRLWHYDAANDKFSSSGHYGANQLYVTEIRDEQETLVVEYKDKQGRVVAKKVQEAGTISDTKADAGFMVTQYVYDDLGNLRLVIQPEGVRHLPTPGEQAPVAPCSPISSLPCSQVAATTSLHLSFDGVGGTIPDKSGVGTGFTMVAAYSGQRLAVDGTPVNPALPGYEPSNLTVSDGTLKLVTNKGIAYRTNNNQLNTLGVKVDARGRLHLEVTVVRPFNGTLNQQAGLWLGLDDKTYLKLVVTENKVELLRELNDESNTVATAAVDQRITSTIAGLHNQNVRLRLIVDAATATAEGFYSTDGVTYLNVGQSYAAPALSIQEMNLTAGEAYAGLFATHRNGTDPVTYTFDNFAVAATNLPAPSACFPLSTLPCNVLEVALPVDLTFDGAVAGTLADNNGAGTGFTLVDAYSGLRHTDDGSTPTNSAVPGYEPSKLTLTGGVLQLVTNKGIAYGPNNNQLNTLGVKVNTQSKLQVETTLNNPYNGTLSEQGGLWLGLHDKTFLKLAVMGNKVELRAERDDATTNTSSTSNPDQRITGIISGLNNQQVRLRLVLDPATNTAEGFYSTDGVTYLNVGAAYPIKTLDIANMGLTGGTAYAGIYATHRNSSTPVTYSFDQFGVKAVGVPVNNDIVELSADFIARWCFAYDYDGRRRMIRKQVPGAGPVEIVYNKRDQPILQRDAKQAYAKKWAFTKYDVLGRPVMTGEIEDESKRHILQGQADAQVGVLYEKEDGSPLGYTLNDSWLAGKTITEANLWTVTYYDKYFGYSSDVKYAFDGTVLGGATPKNERVRGQVTGTRTRILNTNTWLTAVNFYDEKYRLLQAVGDNHMGGVDRVTTWYDFVGKPKQVHTTHQTLAGTHIVVDTMTYDHAGRLLQTWKTMDSGPRVLLAQNEYNELGQLIDKKLHSEDAGTEFLQSVDYRYNIRGWLTSINNKDLAAGATNDENNDVFGMELSYNAPGSTLYDAENGPASAMGYFNGNISEALWRTTDSPLRGYSYHYDKANRLTTANYFTESSSGENYRVWGISYDVNGNIQGMKRKGLLQEAVLQGGATQKIYGDLDMLSYHYNPEKGNQLVGVDDSKITFSKHDFEDREGRKYTAAAPEYAYDQNGNLVRDDNKGITNILYNNLNLPYHIEFGPGNSIEYLYTAGGTKLRKTVVEKGITKVTDYSGLFVYQGDTLFAHTSEGRALYQPQADEPWRYEYHLKDHLGNLRVSFAEAVSMTSVATMELMAAPREEKEFEHVAETRHLDGMKARSGLHAALLSATRNKLLGPSKRVELHKGDSLHVKAFGLYEKEEKNNLAFSLAAWLLSSAVVSTPNPLASGEQQVKVTKNKALPYLGVGLALAPQIKQLVKGAPKAYLRYIVYDKDSAYVTSGYQAVTKRAEQGWEELELSYTAKQDGFAEVYVANESGEEVWFDDMSVSTTQPMLVQENHYDPWGLNLVGIERQGTPDHLF